MSDPVIPPPPAEADMPLAPNGEVKAYDRLGNKVTVPKEKVGELYGMGGRVAQKQEVTAQRLHDEYEAQSTGKKLAGMATVVLPFSAQNALSATGIAPIPSSVEAFNSGVSSAATLGLDEVATKAALDATAGKAAGNAYGRHLLDAREANPTEHMVGQGVGFAAMAAGGGALGTIGKAIPGAGVSALGGIAEQGAARALGGVAARGALGRALSTGGQFAARGAVEGALYSGANQITEDQLGDKEIVADKVFAAMGTGALYGGVGGFALGAGGSLAASGARGLAGAGSKAITRALSRGEGAAADGIASAEAKIAGAADDAVAGIKRAGIEGETAARKAVADTAADASASAKGIAEVTGTVPAQEQGAIRSWFDKVSSKSYQKDAAYEQAWKAAGAGQGLQSTSFAKSAERYLPNGVKDVGEVMMRKGIINAEDGLANAMRHGTPEAMVPKFEAARAVVGARIGEITAASPARIAGHDIGAAVDEIASHYEASAATQPIGRSLRGYADNLYKSLGLERQADGTLLYLRPGQGVPVQDLLRERKALDHMVFENAALDPGVTTQVKRELRGKLEGLIMDGLDEAGGKLPGAVKAEYKALKHDYTALSIGLDAAEDSAARMSKAATFGLTDTLRGGGSILKTVGSKIVRERGNAAAAVLMSRMADMGTLTKALASVDEQVGKAAKGLISAPKRGPLPEAASNVPLRTRAATVLDRAAAAQANPEALAGTIANHTEAFTVNTPNLATNLGTRMTSAYAMLAAKIPTHADPDPFDPHPAARLSDSQAATVVRYGSYIERPMRFFEEAEHGKLTYEGVEVAKTLMPGMFAELQQRTIEGLADMMARGQRPPHAQRERLGILLDIPATPSQRPDHMLLLQQNLVASNQAAKPGPQGATAPKRPIATKSQPSTLDRLEGR